MIAGQGRSSKTRFSGAVDVDPTDRGEPRLGGHGAQRCSPAWAPSGGDDVLVRCDTALGVQTSVDTA